MTAVTECLGVTTVTECLSVTEGNGSSRSLNVQNFLTQKRQLFSLTVIDKFKEVSLIQLYKHIFIHRPINIFMHTTIHT